MAVVGAAFHRDLHQVVSEWATLFGPGLAYGRLLRFEHGPHVPLPSMRVECDLCESWRAVDPLTYEFRLHPDARWQGGEGFSSRPVTAGDVVFSLERLRTPGWPHASLLAAVETITAQDERTVALRLRYPDPDLPQKLANPHAVVLAPETAGAPDSHDGPVIGSGPWVWQQDLSGQTELTAFPDYHRPADSRVGQIRFVPFHDLDSASLAIGLDRVDVAPVAEELWPEIEARGIQSRLVPRQGAGLVLAVNAGAPPMEELEVRRALFFALDPFLTVDSVWDGLGSVGVGVPAVEPGWLLGEDQVRSYFAQPEKAAGLLNARRAPVAVKLTIANYGPQHTEHGRLMAEQLRAAGFRVSVETLTRSQYLSRVWQDGDFQVSLGPLPPVATTNSFLLPLLHSDGQRHITGHQDEELDRLISLQSAEMDPARRGELVQLIQSRVLDQALLFMPLITVERWGFNPRVLDFHPNMAAGDGSFWQAVGLTLGDQNSPG